MGKNRLKFVLVLVALLLSVFYLLPTYRVISTSPEAKAALDEDGLSALKKVALRLGLDLQGGMHLVMEVDRSNLTEDEAEDALDRALEIIRNRVDEFGVREPVIQKEGNDRMIIELPGLQDEARAKKLIGQTALLEFKLLKDAETFNSVLGKIDQALADGQLSSELPFAKKEMLALLTASYNSQAEALAAAGTFQARYRERYPDVAEAYVAEIEQAAELAQKLLPRLVFEEPGINWQSFSDNDGHRNSPGCFRCHDGKHVSPEGETIRLQCNLCHSIPQTVDAGDEPPSVPFVALQQPASHLESNFIRDHRLLANDACVECHGELSFGRDDSSFCANSACHGQTWPLVDLDSASIHPIRLLPIRRLCPANPRRSRIIPNLFCRWTFRQSRRSRCSTVRNHSPGALLRGR